MFILGNADREMLTDQLWLWLVIYGSH